jgi:uncharacterized Zn-finger protein
MGQVSCFKRHLSGVSENSIINQTFCYSFQFASGRNQVYTSNQLKVWHGGDVFVGSLIGGNLQIPLPIHTGKKPRGGDFRCDFCEKAFHSKGHLNRHLHIHTGEKQHSCDFCGKCFVQKCNLKHHRMIHTGEKPYVCSMCGKGFNQKSSLKGHMIVHMKNWSDLHEHLVTNILG